MLIRPNNDTQPLRHPEDFTPFSVWLNDKGQSGELSAKRYRFSYCDQDGYFFADRPPFFYGFLLEVKTNGTGTMGLSQQTSLHIQNAIHCKANRQKLAVKLWGRTRMEERIYRFLGTHLLEMEGQSPTHSAHIRWDKRWDIDEQALCELLRFERDARNPEVPLSLDDTSTSGSASCIHDLTEAECAVCGGEVRRIIGETA